MDSTAQHAFLQGNLNHCAAAQDLLLQSMAQWLIDVAVVAEPYFVSSQPNWAGDTGGSVAIVVAASGPDAKPLTVRERAPGLVVATWGGMSVVGVYFSPNRPLAEFEQFLDIVGAALRRAASNSTVVLGDLNAKSTTWGNLTTDARGEAVEEWAAVHGLTLLNRGTANTCVRRGGGSVVDVTFATPPVASRVSNWRVLDGVETLSDHLYIRFGISTSSGREGGARLSAAVVTAFPRWSLVHLDEELLAEAAVVQDWILQSLPPAEVDEAARRFRASLHNICNVAMPRVRRKAASRKQVFWWTREIEELRTSCVSSRRAFTRYRRRRVRCPEEEDRLHRAYTASRKALQLAIARAKDLGRQQLLEGLDVDPWGRPYRWARAKLRPQTSPITETMEPRLLEDVISALFPSDEPDYRPPQMADPSSREEEVAAAGAEEEEEVPRLDADEVRKAVAKLRAKSTAPGPDGVPGRVLARALGQLGGHLTDLFDKCLVSGRFPALWKEGRLVLLRKEGRPAESPSAYRPIVLLDDTGKLLERVVASRIVRHLQTEGPDLASSQFGFREGRSTLDAIMRLKALSEEAVAAGGGLMAVSLDIANAFNSLPFSCVREALRYHRVPLYLRRLVGDYLQGRSVAYVGRDGRVVRRPMTRGVPQGSVLGPLLWSIGYDWALRGTLPPGLDLVCYADDTMVTARGETYEEAATLAREGAHQMVGRIESLGLRVALDKTEALYFHGPRRRPPEGANVAIGGARIEVKPQMKYLGLHLDSRWNFREHFRRLVPKLTAAAGALGRLLPNVGGPGLTCRRLYTGVIRSMALYGAPVWVDALSRPNKALLRRPQRVMAGRVVRAYRTVSHEAACVLAGTPPWDLDAEVLAEAYRQRAAHRARRRGGEGPPPGEAGGWRRSARNRLMCKWRERLDEPCAGEWTVAAVRPVLKRWVDRRHGTLTYRLVQILSGHGSFGRYLCHIAGREPLPACHHCESMNDTAEHTLTECPAWVVERASLSRVVGNDLSLPAVVRAMVGDERSWRAVLSFCESVMSQKERAERIREDDPLSDPIRQRRRGRRRRAHQSALLLQP